MGGHVTAIDLVVLFVVLSSLAYFVCRAAAAGWYAGKLVYQRKLLQEVSTGAIGNGE